MIARDAQRICVSLHGTAPRRGEFFDCLDEDVRCADQDRVTMMRGVVVRLEKVLSKVSRCLESLSCCCVAFDPAEARSKLGVQFG